MEIGESLVGAYMREVRLCETVAFNTRVRGSQSELDVIGVRAGTPVQVWLAEVATHLDGLNYGGYAQTTKKITDKVVAARAYAAKLYPEAEVTVELWSPIVPRGLLAQLAKTGVDEVVANDGYTDRIRELVAEARKASSLTGDDAFRLLQLLTRLRGDPIHLGRAAAP
jgi:hypothetical protein